MQTVLKNWPEVPWKQGWLLRASPQDQRPFITSSDGLLSAPGCDWSLKLIDPEIPCAVRFFCNGISLCSLKNGGKQRIDLFAAEPGLICGTVCGLPAPEFTPPSPVENSQGITCLQAGSGVTLLLLKNDDFALFHGDSSPDFARIKAETVLEEPGVEAIRKRESEKREKTSRLFSINPRHNPPVALAAETLAARLRDRAGPLRGLWSAAEGFDTERFSLNELYPLIRAWSLIDPATALQLMQTALSLQTGDGGFPAWAAAGGPLSTAAPWPFIVQSFEIAWRTGSDPALLKQHLPALRKYMQWALRRFDPHRDGIPSWQSEQEVFVPDRFERGKATPEVTVFLIAEIEALLRLCSEGGQDEPSGSLTEVRDQLTRTLNTVFWDPSARAFSNAWKDGYHLKELSFGSFVPLLLKHLTPEQRTALLEDFEETGRLPGCAAPAADWEADPGKPSSRLPAFHQFCVLEALRCTNESRALQVNFIQRSREGFAAWFERECIGAARHKADADGSAYALGPITAALILCVQDEFEREAKKAPSAAQHILLWIHRLRLTKGDLRIVLFLLLSIVLVRLIYSLPNSRRKDSRIAEAALNYQQGRFAEALNILRRYPHNALSCLLQANLFMLQEQPESAEELYRKALIQHPGSPSALFGLALSLQMSGRFEEAQRRYRDFIDIHEPRLPDAAGLAREFLLLAREEFRAPPRWRRLYTQPLMNDLGL